MWLLNEIGKFIIEYNEIIGTVLSVISAVFGILSFAVAKQIFKKGINIDKNKVLRQVSLEFVTGFFIPFSKFKLATKFIRNPSKYNEHRILYVRDVIQNNKFSVQFPYFDAHEGDLWDALDVDKGEKNLDEFNIIIGFVEDARRFDRAITDLYNQLDDYLNPPKQEKMDLSEYEKIIERRTSSSLGDFLNTQGVVNMDMFKSGFEMVDKISEYENKLPKKLKISEMKQKLYRD